MDGKETSVKVSLRVRPLVAHEKANKCGTILSYPGKNQVVIGKDRGFTFDYCFDEDTSQFTVYNECVSPLVSSYLDGYNATILAYGQTGSGKTFTMGTSSNKEIKEEGFGIVPRVIRELFATIKEREENTLYTVKVVFLEIYNDDIIDLLYTPGASVIAAPTAAAGAARAVVPPKDKGPPVPSVREMPDGSISVAGVVEEEVKSYESMMGVLERGTLNRTTGATLMNKESSRSHAIFTVLLTQRKLVREAAEGESKSEGLLDTESDQIITSKFHFVDLAGSERLKRTGASGARMNEGININYGLMALGNVISALADEKRRGAHVPFRDSKITRLLQDSLGGNSQTLMIACISPADINFEESLNTLKYANRAKNIKNKPVINRDPNSAKMAQMRARILELEAQLALAGGGDGAPLPSGAVSAMVQPEELLMLKVQNETFETEIKRLNTRLKDVREQLSEISDKLVVVETERDSYKLKLQRIAGTSDATIAASAGASGATGTEGAATRIGFELGIDNGEIGVMQELHKHKHKLQKKLKRKSSALDSALSMIERYQTRFGDLAPMRNGPSADTTEDGAGSDKDDGDDSDGGATRRRLRKLNGGHLTSGSAMDDVKEDEGLEDSEEEEENDIKALTDAAARKEREMSGMMTDMNRTQAELESDISDKTDLLQELTKAREHAQFMRRQYEAKITEMQNERNGILAEREKAMSSVRNDEKAVAKIAEKYEKQLKSLEIKLVEMKKKISDNDRLKRLYAADEAKIKQLNEEISATKKRMVELTRQKTEKMKEHREWVTENNARMKTVLRENETNRGLLKKMKSDLDKQSALLKRRNEEKAQLLKKVNKLEAAPKKAAAGVAAAAAAAPASGAAAALRNNFMKASAKASSSSSSSSSSSAAKKAGRGHRRNVSDSKVDAYTDDSDIASPPANSRDLLTDLQSQLEKEIEDGVRNLEARDELEGMQQASRLLDQTQRDLEQKLLTPTANNETILEWQDSLMFCREERGFLAKRMETKRKELDAYAAGESAANSMDIRGVAAAVDARVWQRVRLPQESRPLLKFLAEQVVELKHRQHSGNKVRKGMEQKLEEITKEYMMLQTRLEAQQREYDTKMAAHRRDAVKRASVEANTAVRVGKVRKAREQRRAGVNEDDLADETSTTGGDVLSRLQRGEKDAGMMHIMQNFKGSGVSSPMGGSGTSTMVGSTATTAAYSAQMGTQSSRRSAAAALSPPLSRQASMNNRQSSLLGSAASPTRGVAAAAAIVGAAGSASALSTLSTSISSTLMTLLSNADRPSLLVGTSLSSDQRASSSAVDLDLDSEDGEHGPFVPSPPRNLSLTNSAMGGSAALSSSVAYSSRSSDHDDMDTNGSLGGARLSAGSLGSNVRSGSGSRGSSGSAGPRFMQHTASSQPKSKPLPTGLAPSGGGGGGIAGRRNSKPSLDLPMGIAASTPLGQSGHLFRSASFDDGSSDNTNSTLNMDGSPHSSSSATTGMGAALTDSELLDGPDDEQANGDGPANVFDRLLDPSKFTGMHKHIHGDKKLHTRQRSVLPTKGSKDGSTPSSSTATITVTPPASATNTPSDAAAIAAAARGGVRPGEWRPPIKGSGVAPSSSTDSMSSSNGGNTPRPSIATGGSRDNKPAWVDNPTGVGAIQESTSSTKRVPREDGTMGSPTSASTSVAIAGSSSSASGPATTTIMPPPAAVLPSSLSVASSATALPGGTPDSVYARLSDPSKFTGAQRVKHAAHADRSRRPGSMTQFPTMSELTSTSTGTTGAVTTAAKLVATTSGGSSVQPTKTSSVKKGPTSGSSSSGNKGVTRAPTSGASDVPNVKAPTSLFPIKLGGMTITPGPAAAALAATGTSAGGQSSGSTTPSSTSQMVAAAASGAVVFTPLTPSASGNGSRQPVVFSFSTSSQSPEKENKNPTAAAAPSLTSNSKDAPATPPRDASSQLQAPLASVGAMSPVPQSSSGDLWREWNTTFGEGGNDGDDGLGE